MSKVFMRLHLQLKSCGTPEKPQLRRKIRNRAKGCSHKDERHGRDNAAMQGQETGDAHEYQPRFTKDGTRNTEAPD